MKESQLISLCRCLVKQEWRNLHDFAASPLFNSRNDVRELLRYIEHYLPKIKDTHLEKTIVWKKLFPQKKYDDGVLRYLMFLTQQLVQKFITLSAWQADEMASQITFIQELRKRNAEHKLIETEFRKTAQIFDKQVLRNFDFYYDTYEWQVEYYEYTTSQQRASVEGFQEFSDALNVFFIAQKLRQGCAALVQSALNKSDVQIDFLEEVLQYLAQKQEMSDIPLVALFFYSYQALSNNEDNVYFGKLKILLFQVDNQFNHSELREFYLYAINCCIRRINAAKDEYIAEVFEIYRKGLETGALLEGESLSRFTYNNIVMAGVRLKEFDWTEKFIYDYKPFLEEKFRDSIFNHVLATFYFKKKDYSKAMSFLQNAEFDDVLHNLDARRMLLCIYYDLSEFDALEAHLEAFKNYLYRQKNLGYHRENCLNLIRFTRRLLQLDFTNPSEIKQLAEEISNTTRLVELSWLLEKLKP
jgi:hypothetical protein